MEGVCASRIGPVSQSKNRKIGANGFMQIIAVSVVELAAKCKTAKCKTANFHTVRLNEGKTLEIKYQIPGPSVFH